MDSVALVLASASPRRRQLLAPFGLALDVSPVDIDETPRPGEAPEALASRLAAAKAAAAARDAPQRLVLAADTVVALEERVLGKPADAADARRMLHALSGRRHQVHTAVAVRRGAEAGMRLSSSEVDFRALSAGEIDAYVATGEPLDKAGAYGIQGLAAIFVARLSGSHSGVVGLPLCETAELLGRFGVHLLPASVANARGETGT